MSALKPDPAYAAATAAAAEASGEKTKLAAGDVAGRRARSGAAFKQLQSFVPHIPGITTKNHTVPTSDGSTITLVEFRPEGIAAPSKAIYHIHGGGMIVGSVDGFAPSISAQASLFQLPIFSIDYRLAPEHPHPTPVNDCYAGLEWLSAHAAELGVDASKIVLFGQSAGGGLAAGVSLMARDKAFNPPLIKQVLIFPMLDDRNLTPIPSIEPHAVWNCDDNITGWGALLGSAVGGPDVSPYAAPARATDLSGLPPTYIEVGQLDIFVAENVEYAAKLVKAAVEVEFHLYPGLPHGFMFFAPDAPQVKAATQNVKRAVIEA